MNINPTIPDTRNSMRVVTFDDYGDAIDFLFGPQQHDAHVARWRGHNRLTQRLADMRAATARCNAEIAAAGSVTAWLRGTK